MEDMWCSFIGWLKEWQTLAAGGFALIAAWVAWRQLNHQRKESKQLQNRRARACKAILPVDLNIFIEYLQECYTIAATIRCMRLNTDRRDTVNLHTLKTPRIPDRIMANIQALVEYLDEYNTSILIKVVQVYQVQNARFRHELEHIDEPWNDAGAWLDFNGTCGNLVFLHILIENIWPFARDEEEKIPLNFSEQKTQNALAVLESELPNDLRIDCSNEDEVKGAVLDYVVGAAKHHFRDLGCLASN